MLQRCPVEYYYLFQKLCLYIKTQTQDLPIICLHCFQKLYQRGRTEIFYINPGTECPAFIPMVSLLLPGSLEIHPKWINYYARARWLSLSPKQLLKNPIELEFIKEVTFCLKGLMPSVKYSDDLKFAFYKLPDTKKSLEYLKDELAKKPADSFRHTVPDIQDEDLSEIFSFVGKPGETYTRTDLARIAEEEQANIMRPTFRREDNAHTCFHQMMENNWCFNNGDVFDQFYRFREKWINLHTETLRLHGNKISHSKLGELLNGTPPGQERYLAICIEHDKKIREFIDQWFEDHSEEKENIITENKDLARNNDLLHETDLGEHGPYDASGDQISSAEKFEAGPQNNINYSDTVHDAPKEKSNQEDISPVKEDVNLADVNLAIKADLTKNSQHQIEDEISQENKLLQESNEGTQADNLVRVPKVSNLNLANITDEDETPSKPANLSQNLLSYKDKSATESSKGDQGCAAGDVNSFLKEALESKARPIDVEFVTGDRNTLSKIDNFNLPSEIILKEKLLPELQSKKEGQVAKLEGKQVEGIKSNSSVGLDQLTRGSKASHLSPMPSKSELDLLKQDKNYNAATKSRTNPLEGDFRNSDSSDTQKNSYSEKSQDVQSKKRPVGKSRVAQDGDVEVA